MIQGEETCASTGLPVGESANPPSFPWILSRKDCEDLTRVPLLFICSAAVIVVGKFVLFAVSQSRQEFFFCEQVQIGVTTRVGAFGCVGF